MSVCTRCTVDKPEREFRHKTSGPRSGYRFPVCIQCDGEQHDANIAAEARSRGYVVTQPDPVKAEREEADRAASVEAVR